MVVLKTLADQMVIALNNAGLRRLVKNLSVTDEKSGLLKRASYIDLLLAESKRAIQNASALSVLLLQFGKSGAMNKEYGEAEVQAVMEKAGQLFAANIRSNDLAFRYDTTTIAILLGETAEKEAMLAVEKLRKIIAEVRLPAKDEDAQGSAGAVLRGAGGGGDPHGIRSCRCGHRSDQSRRARAGAGHGAGAGEDCGVGAAALAAGAVA